MTERTDGIEFYIDADAKAILDAKEKVYESTTAMEKDFNKVDSAVKSLITKQTQLGSSVDKAGNIIRKNGKVNDGATQAVKALIAKQNQLVKSSDNVDRAYQAVNRAGAKTNRGLKMQQGFMQQAGYQVGDFAVQVQGGQNAMVAFNQQFSQLAGFLGPAGAVIGGISAVAFALASALIPSLTNSKDDTQELIDKIKELGETQILSAELAEFAAMHEKKSQKEREKSVKSFDRKIEAINKEREATLALVKDVPEITYDKNGNVERFGKANETMAERVIRANKQAQTKIKEFDDQLVELKAKQSLASKEFEKGKETLKAYELASKGLVEQTEEQKESINDLITSLKQEAEETGKTGAELIKLRAARMGATETQVAEAVAIYKGIEAKQAEAKQLEESQKAAEKEAETFKTVLSSYQQKAEALLLTGQAQDEYNARQKLGLDDSEKIPAAIQAEIDALQQRRELKAQIAEEDANRRQIDNEYDQLTGDLGESVDPLVLLEEQLAAEREIILAHQAALLEDESLNAQQRAAVREQHQNDITSIEQRAANARQAIEEREKQSKLAATSSMFSNLSNLMNTGSKKLFAIGKASAIAGAIVDGYAAVSKTMASMPYPFNIPLAAAQAAASAVQVQNIAKQKIGGASSFGGAGTFAGGQPAIRTTEGQSSSFDRNITIAGIDRDSLISGGQLVNTLNQALGDGYSINFAGG